MQAHGLVGEVVESTLAELGGRTGIAEKLPTAEWGPGGNVCSIEMQWRWEDWQQRIYRRIESEFAEVIVIAEDRMYRR